MGRITNIELFRQPDQYILTTKKTICIAELPNFLADAMTAIDNHLRKVGMTASEVPYAVIHSFRNMDINSVTVGIGYQIPEITAGTDLIISETIPQRDVVSCYYQGDNFEMEPVYDEMVSWVIRKGREIVGDAYEYYYSEPNVGIENMLTKIVLPLR